MKGHVPDSVAALYVSGDLALWRRAMVKLHVRRCERCRGRIAKYRADRDRVRLAADTAPKGLDWNRLASEMTANIRVGLAAGECVAPREARTAGWGWRPAAAVAGFAALLAGAWWLNMPASGTRSLGRAVHAVWNAGGRGGEDAGLRRGVIEGPGPVVEANASGIELRENGSSLCVSQGTARPVAVSINAQGSASARYVDAETGQITITSVYAQ